MESRFTSGYGKWFDDIVFRGMRLEAADIPDIFDLLELCSGLGTGYIGSRCVGINTRCVGAYEYSTELLPWMIEVHGRQLQVIHCGPVDGNILLIAIDKFQKAHIIIAGPPCPPWSAKGSRQSWADERSKPFVHVMKIIVYQARYGHLLVFIIENVLGFCQKQKDGSVPLDEACSWLRKRLGVDWQISSNEVNSADFGVPQNRPRVYIVGVKIHAGGRSLRKPFHIPKFSARGRLSDIMDTDVTRSCWTSAELLDYGYSHGQLENLHDFKLWYQPEMNEKSCKGQLACFPYDRTPMSRTAWSVTKHVDVSECLTATGPVLHVMSLGEGCDATDSRVALTFDKPLSQFERGRLQGYPEWFIDIGSGVAKDSLKAFGNAMTVPVVASVLYAAMAKRYCKACTADSLSAIALERSSRAMCPVQAVLSMCIICCLCCVILVFMLCRPCCVHMFRKCRQAVAQSHMVFHIL